MELKDTVDMMLSENYQDRFIAELRQLEIRMAKLGRIIAEYDADMLDFTPDCPISLLKKQLKAMETYRSALVLRAYEERIGI